MNVTPRPEGPWSTILNVSFRDSVVEVDLTPQPKRRNSNQTKHTPLPCLKGRRPDLGSNSCQQTIKQHFEPYERNWNAVTSSPSYGSLDCSPSDYARAEEDAIRSKVLITKASN